MRYDPAAVRSVCSFTQRNSHRLVVVHARRGGFDDRDLVTGVEVRMWRGDRYGCAIASFDHDFAAMHGPGDGRLAERGQNGIYRN